MCIHLAQHSAAMHASVGSHNRGQKSFEFALYFLSIIDAMKNFLKRFNLDLDKDIVGTTFDGASVMKKTGKDIKPENQICQVHGIHLGMLLVCTYMWIKVYITFMCKLQVYKMLSLRKEKNKMLKKKMRLTLTLTLTWMMMKGCL